MGLFEKTLRFIISYYFVWTYIGAIALVFFYQLRKLFQNLKGVKKDIDAAKNELPEDSAKGNDTRLIFAERFESINSKLIQNPTLGHHWHEYKEHIIRPAAVTSGEISQNYKNSIQPEFFFSFDRIVGEKINLRKVDSLPGKLSGLGILGTFIGLSCGVILATGQSEGFQNTAKLQEAIGTLLNGAGLAFFTSVAGLLTSLLFSTIDKRLLAKIDNKIAEFNRKLEACLEFVTNEKIGSVSVEELKTQTKHLEEFNSNIAASIGDVLFEKMEQTVKPQFSLLIDAVNSLKEVQAKASEKFYQEMADKVSGGLSSFAGDQIGGLKQAFNDLSTGLPEIVRSIATSQKAVQEQNTLFMKQFSERMMNEQTSLAHSMTELTSQLKSEIGGMGSTLIDEAHSAQKTATESMKTEINKISQQFIEMESSSREKQEAFISKINESISLNQKNNETFISTSEKMSSVVSSFNDISQGQKEIINSTTEGLRKSEEISEKFLIASKVISESSESVKRLCENLGQFSSQFLEGLEIIESSNKSISDTWNRHDQRFGELDSSTSRWFETINSGLHDYGSNVNRHMQTIQEGTSNIASSLAQAVDEFKEVIEDFSEQRVRN